MWQEATPLTWYWLWDTRSYLLHNTSFVTLSHTAYTVLDMWNEVTTLTWYWLYDMRSLPIHDNGFVTWGHIPYITLACDTSSCPLHKWHEPTPLTHMILVLWHESQATPHAWYWHVTWGYTPYMILAMWHKVTPHWLCDMRSHFFHVMYSAYITLACDMSSFPLHKWHEPTPLTHMMLALWHETTPLSWNWHVTWVHTPYTSKWHEVTPLTWYWLYGLQWLCRGCCP